MGLKLTDITKNKNIRSRAILSRNYTNSSFLSFISAINLGIMVYNFFNHIPWLWTICAVIIIIQGVLGSIMFLKNVFDIITLELWNRKQNEVG